MDSGPHTHPLRIVHAGTCTCAPACGKPCASGARRLLALKLPFSHSINAITHHQIIPSLNSTQHPVTTSLSCPPLPPCNCVQSSERWPSCAHHPLTPHTPPHVTHPAPPRWQHLPVPSRTLWGCFPYPASINHTWTEQADLIGNAFDKLKHNWVYSIPRQTQKNVIVIAWGMRQRWDEVVSGWAEIAVSG